jgi:hypothetical protein
MWIGTGNRRHFCPSQNPTWPDPCLNPGRRGGKPATNRLSYGAACMFHCQPCHIKIWQASTDNFWHPCDHGNIALMATDEPRPRSYYIYIYSAYFKNVLLILVSCHANILSFIFIPALCCHVRAFPLYFRNIAPVGNHHRVTGWKNKCLSTSRITFLEK